MTCRPRKVPVVIAALIVFIAVAVVGHRAQVSANTPGAADARGHRWEAVSVELPVSNEIFPPGAGAASAEGQCLICHSAGMVLRQPPLTKETWKAEIMKMRTAYGATVPLDEVDALAEYLHSINGL
jgi:hypothetical protein